MIAKGLTSQEKLVEDIQRLDLELVPPNTVAQITTLVVHPTLIERIKEGQKIDSFLQRLQNRTTTEGMIDYSVDTEGSLRFRERLCMPNDAKIRKEILIEAHQSPYTIHL